MINLKQELYHLIAKDSSDLAVMRQLLLPELPDMLPVWLSTTWSQVSVIKLETRAMTSHS